MSLQAGSTYKAAKLLKRLEQVRSCQCSAIAAFAKELSPWTRPPPVTCSWVWPQLTCLPLFSSLRLNAFKYDIRVVCCVCLFSSPLSLWITRLAAAKRSTMTSQRGVSGMKTRITACMVTGRARNPIVHRHPA